MAKVRSRFRVFSDEEWARIEPLLPSNEGRRGHPFGEHRKVVEGIAYRYRTGIPWRDLPREQFGPWQTGGVEFFALEQCPHWMESVWVDDDGTLYGWYHCEPIGLIAGTTLTAPKIGAVVSFDGGHTVFDLGVVLESGDPLVPTAANAGEDRSQRCTQCE